jgi:integrase
LENKWPLGNNRHKIYIKDLLGHFDIKTTERYLHVSKQKLANIISPLDDFVQKENIDW